MNKRNSSYNKIRRDLYESVEKSERNKSMAFVIVILGVFLLASVLLFSAALIHGTSPEMQIYYFGDEEQKIEKELTQDGDVLLIDMNALSRYCKIERSSFFEKARYRINGTEAVFENGSSIAEVNGFEVEMQSPAKITDKYCLVPIESIKEIILGISIENAEGKISVNMIKEVYMIAKDPEVEYITDVSEFLKYIHSTEDYIYTLANKENPLGKDFPEDKDSLIDIPLKYANRTMYLYVTAEKALEAMMQDIFAAGFDDTFVTSAYRSYAYQEDLVERYVKQYVNQGFTREEALALVYTDTAEPGKSEHQTGLCVDLTTEAINDVDNVFATTEVFRWLTENSWKYGFVLRYPEDKVEITGYAYESWHYRFVGIDVAMIMHQTGLCYEEYLEYFN